MTDLQLHQVLHRETTPLYVFDLAALPQRVATAGAPPRGGRPVLCREGNPFLLSALNGWWSVRSVSGGTGHLPASGAVPRPVCAVWGV